MLKYFKFNLSDKHKKLLPKLGYALVILYFIYGIYDFATGLKLNLPIVIFVIWQLFRRGEAQAKKAAGAISGAVVKNFTPKTVENLNNSLAIGTEPRFKLSNIESNALGGILTTGLKAMIEKEVQEKLHSFFIKGIINLAFVLGALMLLQVILALTGLVTLPVINTCPPN